MIAWETMQPLLRAYEPGELGADGYPVPWHRPTTEGAVTLPAVKNAVRMLNDNRCERCGHPYLAGDPETVGPRGEWSCCDEHCTHGGPARYGDDGTWFGLTTPDDVCEAIANPVPGFLVWAHWRILTVHHLDGHKANLRWWNLAALCQRCHLIIQGRVKLAQTYPWQHSEWFRLHAAGYYARAYLGEELTRAETLERLDELLALERAGT